MSIATKMQFFNIKFYIGKISFISLATNFDAHLKFSRIFYKISLIKWRAMIQDVQISMRRSLTRLQCAVLFFFWETHLEKNALNFFIKNVVLSRHKDFFEKFLLQ
ncbi:unnamed protein product [Blepharisma stoltei]|uniref:Uncharacterized protein n=1 Tax=Blepharisma stoltei TaxID=1481888 RepID=A0AAU9K0E5_9CILI|nr:unnamed protein product [Blepharisma stoltei]